MPHTTTDHDLIRRWAEERGGDPAVVQGIEGSHDPAGLLRIDFHTGSKLERLRDVSWEEFFERFDQAEAEFVYEDELGGHKSKFARFVRRKAG